MKQKGENKMQNEKKHRGRPRKNLRAETSVMTHEGTVNYILDKEIKSELENQLSNKSEPLTAEERKYLESKHSNHSKTLNIRFTESEYREIENKCQQFGYRSKSTYVRDCVKARVDLMVDKADFSETNRLIKSVSNNINQIAVRLHSTGRFYAEDLLEIKRGVNEIWQLLLSIQSKQQTGRLSAISQTEIRPSTVYMCSLMPAEPTASVLPPTSEQSEQAEQGAPKSSHIT